MAFYEVTLSSKRTVAQPSETVQVMYEAKNYNAAWVGSRTVCRLGTLFKDDPRCQKPSNAREFWTLTTPPEKFLVSPSSHTVRAIFVENTRKTGKQRMTTLSKDEILKVLQDRKIPVSGKLETALSEVFDGTDGLRITTAVAHRLGLKLEEAESDDA